MIFVHNDDRWIHQRAYLIHQFGEGVINLAGGLFVVAVCPVLHWAQNLCSMLFINYYNRGRRNARDIFTETIKFYQYQLVVPMAQSTFSLGRRTNRKTSHGFMETFYMIISVQIWTTFNLILILSLSFVSARGYSCVKLPNESSIYDGRVLCILSNGQTM